MDTNTQKSSKPLFNLADALAQSKAQKLDPGGNIAVSITAMQETYGASPVQPHTPVPPPTRARSDNATRPAKKSQVKTGV